MQAFNTIVVATDFSGAANQAVRRAALIARQQGAELHLLHVATPLALYPGLALEPPDDGDHPPANDQYGALARVLLHEHYGIQVRQAKRFGRAHSQIADYALAVHADLVVVGARGEGFVLSLLLGSTASRLLRVHHGPVLVVRGEPTEPYGRVLGAVDFLSHAPAVAAWAAKLAGQGHTQLVHVLEQRSGKDGADATMRQYRQEILSFAENAMAALISGLPAGDISRRIETGYPPARILECAGDCRADLIVVGRQGATGLEEFLLGSVSKDVVQAADCDVLVVGED